MKETIFILEMYNCISAICSSIDEALKLATTEHLEAQYESGDTPNILGMEFTVAEWTIGADSKETNRACFTYEWEEDNPSTEKFV